MANERYGNNYLVTIGVEGSYGTESANYEVVLPDILTLKHNIDQIDISRKTASLAKDKCEKQAGYQSGTGTLSGGLTTAADVNTLHGILLEAFFMDSASPFVVPAVGTTPKYYTIHKYFNDDKAETMLGAVLETLEISGESGGLVNYSAGWRGKSVTWEDSVATKPSGDPFSAIPTTCPVKFGDATLTTLGGSSITKMNSFNLSLTNTFADGRQIYQNGVEKLQEILVGSGGTLQLSWNYNSAEDTDISEDIMIASLQQIVFALTDETNTWTFTCKGKIIDYDLADPDKGIFESSATLELMGDSENESISIAIS